MYSRFYKWIGDLTYGAMAKKTALYDLDREERHAVLGQFSHSSLEPEGYIYLIINFQGFCKFERG